MWSRAHPGPRWSHCVLVASEDEGLVENLVLEQGLLSHYLMDLQRSKQPPPTSGNSQRKWLV